MSRGTVVAKRYAKALFELAQQAGSVSDVELQLKLVVQAVQHDDQVAKFLSTPNVTKEQKVEALKVALSGHVTDLVINTLELLIHRGRIDSIEEVYTAYMKIAGEALGQADAIVYTAKELSEAEVAKVASRFSVLLGKMIRVTQIVEPALLGGMQVRIGDRLYDGSLSGKLARLEKSLKSQAL